MTCARIMIVEDEVIAALSLQGNLENDGYQIAAVVSSGEEAIQKAVQTRPDLILMDIHLAGEMDGVEAATHLRQSFHVPVIFLTAFSDDDTVQRAIATDPFAYLIKPFNARELKVAIEIALYKHRVEEKLAQSEERYRLLVERATIGISLSSPDGKHLYNNPAAATISGYSADELNQLRAEDLYVDLEDREKLIENLYRHGIYNYEHRIRRKDGQIRWLKGTSWAIRKDGGEVDAFQGVIEDVTEYKRLESHLRQTQKMEAVGQLTAGVSHNFNNMLMGILASLETATVAEGDPKAALREVEAIVLRAGEMIGQLMHFSRTDEQGPSQALDLSDLVERAITVGRQTIDRKIDIRNNVPATVPEVSGDANQLEQVFLNLLLNARDALEEGRSPSPYIHFSAHVKECGEEDLLAYPQAQPGTFLCLEISDNGAGMDEVVQEHIFEPFFTTKEVGKGTGLGLATAYAMMQEHRGAIECESQPGSGTTFYLYLPVAVPAESPVRQSRQEQESAAIPRGTETILIVEDEEMVRARLSSMLERYGYGVLTANDGTEGVEVFARERERIALVLLDLSLPGLSGVEVLSKMRILEPEVRVIISTGYASPKAEQLEVETILQKPYRMAYALRSIRECLDA